MTPKRVLVCGGRDLTAEDRLRQAMTRQRLHNQRQLRLMAAGDLPFTESYTDNQMMIDAVRLAYEAGRARSAGIEVVEVKDEKADR